MTDTAITYWPVSGFQNYNWAFSEPNQTLMILNLHHNVKYCWKEIHTLAMIMKDHQQLAQLGRKFQMDE